MLSENTGSHEELGDCTLGESFDIQEQADTIHRALTMDPEERRLRAARLNEIVRERDPECGSPSSWTTSGRSARRWLGRSRAAEAARASVSP